MIILNDEYTPILLTGVIKDVNDFDKNILKKESNQLKFLNVPTICFIVVWMILIDTWGFICMCGLTLSLGVPSNSPSSVLFKYYIDKYEKEKY